MQWMVSKYLVSGDNEEIRNLYDRMKALEAGKGPLARSGMGNRWMGRLVADLGTDLNAVGCRGEWDDLSMKEGCLTFIATTAWYRYTDLETLIIKNYPSVSVYFISMEPFMGIYEKNDATGKFFPEKYNLYFEKEASRCYGSEKEVVDALNRRFSLSLKNMGDVRSFLTEYNDRVNLDADCHSRHVYMNEFSIV